MRIAIMGSGGIGGYFGARLAASGEDVGFVARGAHLAAMQQNGLRVESQLGDVTIKPVRVTTNPAELGPVDLVMLGVKLWDTPAAIEAVRPLVKGDTAIVSFQNGVAAIDALGRAFGKGAVLGGTAHIATTIGAPGVIKHTGPMARLTIGEVSGGISPRVTAIIEAAKKAGIDSTASPDIQKAIWEKFVFLSSFSGVATVSRSPKSVVMADPDLRKLMKDALHEVTAVAHASDIGLPADYAEKTFTFVDGLPPTMKPSLLHDLERGNRLEVEFLSGMVAKLGAEKGIDTPVHRTIYAALKPLAGGRAA